MKSSEIYSEIEYTHNFHPYPAKFPAHAIVDLLVDSTKRHDTVLDPFCGSGTTLVACRLLERNAIGIELNPVGALISDAKSAYYDRKNIEALEQVISVLGSNSIFLDQWLDSTPSSAVIPDYANRDHWFEPHVLKELGALKYTIEKLEVSPKLSLLVKMAFSRILVPVSNQDSETRYVATKKQIKKGDVIRLFVQVLSDYHSTLKASLGKVSGDARMRVIEGDARPALAGLRSESIDFAITSPPYINSYDYYLYNKQRIFWLGKDPQVIRRLEIGGHHGVGSKSYEIALEEYEADLTPIFADIHRILKPNRCFAVLAGDGIVENKLIEINSLVAKLATKTYFTIISEKSTPLRNVSKRFIKGTRIDRKRHYVFILQKN